MSFVESTEKFLAAATWLSDEDAPAVQGLRAAADDLDKALNPPLLAQYRLFYSGLLKKAPQGEGNADPLEGLLKR